MDEDGTWSTDCRKEGCVFVVVVVLEKRERSGLGKATR
jgi:hypothetical protein